MLKGIALFWPYLLALAVLPWALWDQRRVNRERDINAEARRWAQDAAESAQDRAWRDAESTPVPRARASGDQE